MPLHIDRVETEMEVVPEEHGRNTSLRTLPENNTELRERLRLLVLQIVEEELERLRREQG